MSQRRDELLESTAEYILANGVSDLSLRPLARAIGTKARLLIYHFGSREKLISAALTVVLRRVQDRFLTMEADVLEFWRWAVAPKNRPYLLLVFEIHGLAPRNPHLFGGYVREAIESWKTLIVPRIKARRGREELATMIIAVFDGLLMDYLATGDRARTTRSLQLFIKKIGGKL